MSGSVRVGFPAAPSPSGVRRVLVAVGGTFVEARPQVQGIVALRLVVGNVLGHGGALPDTGAVLLADVAWWSASAAIYVGNGLSDLVGDRRNGSLRPLAAGRLRVADAETAVVVLAGVALLSGAATGLGAVLAVAAFLVLGGAYSSGPRPLKERAAGASVTAGAAGAATPLFGALSVHGQLTGQVVVVASVLGLWMLVAGNAKDFGDEPGDRLAGRRTLPLVLGPARARRVLSVGVLVVGVLAVILAGAWPGVRSLALLGGAAVLMVAAWRLPGRPWRDPRTAYRVFMWSQVLVNLALICGRPTA